MIGRVRDLHTAPHSDVERVAPGLGKCFKVE